MTSESPLRDASRGADRLMRFWRIVRTAYSSWGAIIGTILATIALTSLAIRVFTVPPTETLLLLISAYRMTFHPPIDFVLSWVPFPIPPAAKDAVVIYLSGAGVLFRALSFGQPSERVDRSLSTRLKLLSGRLRVAAIWPRSVYYFFNRPSYIIRTKNKFNGRLPARSRAIAERTIREFMPDAEIVGTDRSLILVYAATLLAAIFSLLIGSAAVEQLVR